MSKRHHRDESDNLESIPHARHSAKRARTGSSDDEREDSPQPQAGPSRDTRTGNGRNNTRGAGRAEDADDMTIDEEEDEPMIPQVDDEEFERKHSEHLRQHLAKRKKVQGGVAEFGIIEAVDMTQFMCHKNLNFDFGPQINFLIGHNGSGKSAVLSAITIALGGKAISTGRGNGLKSFIREGQSVAEVTIKIKNQGEEAFKPQEYGKSIIITRRFTKDGSSTWKIKNEHDKLVSSKKDELSAICDHMNIQVDNPMNVLTQDAARQFLSASKPEDKYQFFLRGTQLTQLSDEYQLCLDNISLTTKLLIAKKAAIPDLEERRDLISAKYAEANKARQQKEKLQEMNKELAWAHVATKEEELKKAIAEVAKAEKKLPKIQESIEQEELELGQSTAQVEAYEKEVTEMDNFQDKDNQKGTLTAELKKNKEKLAQFKKDANEINDSVAALNNQIKELERSMEVEAQKMAVNTQAKREETQAKIAEARAHLTDFETRMNDLIAKRRALSVEADQIKAQGAEPERTMADCRKIVQEHEHNIATAKQRENDIYVPYGNNIKQVLEVIQRSRWHGETPIGPLGLYVTANDPRSWGNVLRKQLGSYLVSFAVTDSRDIPQLKQILSKSKNDHMGIITAKRDLFDYSRGEPPSHVLTVLRALTITDPFVLRILIDQSGIESRVLSPTRREAQSLLQSLGGGRAWSADGMAVEVFREGGVHSIPLGNLSLAGAMSQLLTGRDVAADVEFFQQAKEKAQMDYQAAWDFCDGLKAEYRTRKQKIDVLNAEEAALQKKLRDTKSRLNNLEEEANAELPAGLAGMEEAKKEAENEKASLLIQYGQIETNKSAVDAVQAKLLTQLNELKQKDKDREAERNVIMKKIEVLVEKSVTAQHNLKHYRAKLNEGEESVRTSKAALEVVEQEFKDWTEQAEKICKEPYPKPRKPDEIQRSIESTKKALAERAKKSGASVDVLVKQLNEAEKDLVTAKSELRRMIALTKALKASVIYRLHRWEEFRRHIALRCKQIFQSHLSMRGYYGKIMFDHLKQKLELRVKTDDQTQTQGAGDKDPKSLSGGEKSFSTICLLLSLWECIGCPVRCLDEFDVFMDAVNRRISMKMMIDTAKLSDKKQYILITPQDMSSVMVTETVKVLRMPDPERAGNGTLPFAPANA